MNNVQKSTNSKETTNNGKKKIPLRVLISLFFTCLVRQLKRHFFMPKQDEAPEDNEKASKSLKTIFTFSIIILIIVILLKGCSNTYYTSTGTYQKIEADENQEAIEEPEVTQPVAEETEIDFDNHVFDNSVTLLSYGNVATAANNKVSVDVANVTESSANMVLEIYIPDDELISKIGTNGRTKASQKDIDAKVEADPSYSSAVCVAKSGLIYPGNKITTLDLNTLEDGTVLPAGEYEAFYKETYYDDNGSMHSVDASLAITLVVQQEGKQYE